MFLCTETDIRGGEPTAHITPLQRLPFKPADTGKLFPDQRPGEPMNVILDRTVRFLPDDRIPNAYSPLQDRYPDANVDVPLRELIQLLVGKATTVQKKCYFVSLEVLR